MCSLIIGLGFVKATKAYTAGITSTDENLNYSIFAPDNIKLYAPDILNNTENYISFDLPQLGYINYDVMYVSNPIYKVNEYISLDNMLHDWQSQPINGVDFDNLGQTYNYISTPYTISSIPTYFDVYWENLVIPTETGINANMAYTYDDFLSANNNIWFLYSRFGTFNYFTCKVAYWSYNNDGYAYVDYLDIEYNFSDIDIIEIDYYGSPKIHLLNLCYFIENELNTDYNLGQFFMYITDLHIYGSNENFLLKIFMMLFLGMHLTL